MEEEPQEIVVIDPAHLVASVDNPRVAPREARRRAGKARRRRMAAPFRGGATQSGACGTRKSEVNPALFMNLLMEGSLGG